MDDVGAVVIVVVVAWLLAKVVEVGTEQPGNRFALLVQLVTQPVTAYDSLPASWPNLSKWLEPEKLIFMKVAMMICRLPRKPKFTKA